MELRRQPPGRIQRVGAVVTGVGASTYVGLKAAWVAGGTYGVTSLGDSTESEWRWVNAETGALGVLGLLLAVALGSRWGLRLPWWLVAPPLWCGAGLLAPFVVLLPAAVVLALAGHPVETASSDPREPQLAGWVFALVYAGFAAVAVGLALAVPAYVRARYGHLVVGRLGDRTPRRLNAAVWTAAIGTGLVAAIHLAWALDLPLGRTRDPSLLEGVGEVVFAGLALLTTAAVLVWALRRPAGLRVAWPALTLWVGTGWMLSQALSLPQLFAAERWAPAGLTYPAHVVVTALTVAAGLAAALACAATSRTGSPSPGSPSPGTSSPGTSSPGTSSPGTSSPGTSSPGQPAAARRSRR